MSPVRKLVASIGLGLLSVFALGQSIFNLVNHFLGSGEPATGIIIITYLGMWLIGTFIIYKELSRMEKQGKVSPKTTKKL